MTALVERIIQKFTEAAPIETTVSRYVAGSLENLAARLARFEPDESDAAGGEQEAA